MNYRFLKRFSRKIHGKSYYKKLGISLEFTPDEQ